jgi:hypothetical protein
MNLEEAFKLLDHILEEPDEGEDESLLSDADSE